MKFFKNLLLLGLSILSTLPTLAQSKGQYKIEQTATGPQSYTRANVLSRWVPVPSLDGFRLTPASFPVSKDYDASLSFSPGVFNWSRGGRLTFPNNFQFLDYHRDARYPLDSVFYQHTLVMNRSLLDNERANPDIWKKVYYEINGNALGHLETAEPFFLASTQEVINQLASTTGGLPKGLFAISTNLERSYPFWPSGWDTPGNGDWNTMGVKQHFPNAESIYITCESEGLKGQRLSLKEIWDRGQFPSEVIARFGNHSIAIHDWLRASVPGTRVVDGNGNLLYYTGSPVFDYDEQYDSYARLQAPANIYWSYRSNYGTISAGGVTITSRNQTLWEGQAWMNNYTYPGSGYLTNEDWDYANSHRIDYNWIWSKVKPDKKRLDLCLPAWHFINRAMLDKAGLGNLSYVHQTHRWEWQYQRETPLPGQDLTRSSFVNSGLLDEALCPPWHNEGVAMLTLFYSNRPFDGLTVWRTFPQYGGQEVKATEVNHRPQAEGEAYSTGFRRLLASGEYLKHDGSVFTLYPHDVLVNYEVDGGDYGRSANHFGDGYFTRSIRDICFDGNRQSEQTKASIQVKLIQKNGKVWAQVLALNWGHQRPDEVTKFSLRFLPGQHPALLGQVDVSGFEIRGYNTTLVEVCLTP